MTDADKLKTYMGMTETNRKWISVMDTKAGFISAMNAGLLGFIWTGAKLICSVGWDWPKGLALTASTTALLSLLLSLNVVLPRYSLEHVFGRGSKYVDGFKAISFYGYVAKHYPKGHEGRFVDDVKKMDDATLIDEALEQHFTTSHVAKAKCSCVAKAGLWLKITLLLTGASLISKALG